jgi:hypothetical protein
MYGMVNKAVEEYVSTYFGEEKWEEIRQHSGVEVEVFISNEIYPDEVTYQLLASASHVLGISEASILESLGEHWILKTGRESYGAMLDSCGSTFLEFLQNLPNFNSHLTLIFPRLNLPRLVISDATDSSVCVHYYARREGSQPFVLGLIRGLGKRFKLRTQVKREQAEGPGATHDVFSIQWSAAPASRARSVAA